MGAGERRRLTIDRSRAMWPTGVYRGVTAVLLLAISAACNSNNAPPSPSPGPSPSETITGRERIGWDQPAGSAAELATFRYAIYVNGVRSQIAEVTCDATAGTAGFACSGRLPAMVPGTHTLELAAFIDAGGVIEGARSAPLRVTVTGATAPAPSSGLQPGEHVSTVDGVTLVAELVTDGLDDPVDIALTPDGRIFVAERSGSIRLVSEAGLTEALAPGPEDTGMLSLALAPDFARSGQLFAAHTVVTADGESVRVARYRAWGDRLIERMVLLPDIPASDTPSAALRFGPDGRLYAAFDAAADRDAAERLSDWRGKILRLEPDGRTPEDQPAASPVFWSGLHVPGGLDWSPDTNLLWITERGAEGRERLRAIGTSGERPVRTDQRTSYVLPEGAGAGSLVFHSGAAIAEFAGNLFVAAREGGYVLRVHFDAGERTRATSSERLLEFPPHGVRAVAAGRDGALYVATERSLWRLTSARPQRQGSR